MLLIQTLVHTCTLLVTSLSWLMKVFVALEIRCPIINLSWKTSQKHSQSESPIWVTTSYIGMAKLRKTCYVHRFLRDSRFSGLLVSYTSPFWFMFMFIFMFIGTFDCKSELCELSWGKINVWILCLVFRLFNHCCNIYCPVYKGVHRSQAPQCHMRLCDLESSSISFHSFSQWRSALL